MAKRGKRSRHDGRQPGLGIDAYGGPLIDPTKNVIALVKAEAKFAKTIREADRKLSRSEHRHLTEVGKLRADHAETLRVSDLDRLDKTRQVDVLAATASAAALATAVQTLANTNDRNTETLRNLVTATAQAMAKATTDQALVLSAQTDSIVKGINAQIAELQKLQYQGAGKSSVSDPMMAEMAAKMDRVLTVIAQSTGQKQGGTDMRVWIGWAIAALVGLFAIYNAIKPH